jgi:hypothetical protein
MNGWTKSALVGLALTSAGCSLIQGPGMSGKHHALNPSSTVDNEDELRLLEKPSGIAAQTEDAIVRVVGPGTNCTGTAIADDLILTAHHCIVERGAHGEFEKKLVDPESVRIELGGDYFAWGEVGVRHIVTPPCGESGGSGDIAVLVLKRKLIGLATMTVRDTPPKVGEFAFPFGFGRCALSGDAIKRKSREASAIKAVANETLALDAAICPGDSGGPVFARGGHEIIGVISLSAMDHDERTKGASLMARVDVYPKVIEDAQHIADGMSPQELPPLECKH